MDSVATGGTVLDPDVVAQFLGHRSTRDRIEAPQPGNETS